ncbi:MAG: DNA-3-methyladenine glycosylase [Candidatus Nanopelagicales bacterium]
MDGSSEFKLGRPLGRGFFDLTPVDLAHQLLGCVLATDLEDGQVKLRITEVEAYGDVGQDPGSHAFRGMTERNSSMFLPGGHVYVYRSYGIHWCMNIVAGRKNQSGGVLLRGGEVINGVDLAMRRRNSDGVCRMDRDLARGPGRLGSALGITKDLNGADLVGNPKLRLYKPISITSKDNEPVVESSTRTGVSGEGRHALWRFYLAGEPTVSPHKPAAS